MNKYFERKAYLQHPVDRRVVEALNFKGVKVVDIRHAPPESHLGEFDVVWNSKKVESESKRLIKFYDDARSGEI